MKNRITGAPRRLFAAGAALLLALGTFAAAADASTLRVKVDGTVARRKGVAVAISGRDHGTTDTKTTNARGLAVFTGIPGDAYTVTPAKWGFRFTPAGRLVEIPDGAGRTATFKIAPLPNVGALEASPADLLLHKTLAAEVVVTATDGGGRGIEGAPIAAVSSDTFYVSVSPATAVTDALGRATFTLTAFGSIGYSRPLTPLALPVVATETVTFTSGGWRGTPVRTAQTAVTVEEGLEADLWLASGHADVDGEPFRHWDGDGVVSKSCARCHSRPGFLDYVADWSVDVAPPVGTTVDCLLCHDSAALALTEVRFPSYPTTAAVTGLGKEAICMTCHQGRESGVSVEAKLAGKPIDTIDATISFTNIHYYAAAATLYGQLANGGYQYAGLAYDRKFTHVASKDTCIQCHDQHSLALRLEDCLVCHPGAVDYAGVKKIRMAASTQDYDGDGNVTEGVAEELEGLSAILLQQIQAYAAAQGFPIVYSPTTYPYFLYAAGGGYKSFTPRLLKACYNYQLYQKDPGTHAHSAKYIAELLHDSIQDLAGSAILGGTPVAGIARNDLNHFDTTAEAFRHWDNDADGLVDAACSRCHAGEAGFLDYIADNVVSAVPLPPASRLSCQTCHTADADFSSNPARRYVGKVIFPSPDTDQTVILNDPLDPDDSFICISCHQGRESKKTIDVAIAAAAAPGAPDDDTEYAALKFKNVHYLSAGASLYGKQAGVGYEYAGKTYDLKFNHWGGDSPKCFYCHDVSADRHTFLPRIAPVCLGCHTEIVGGDIQTIRYNRPYDYNGNENTTEKLIDEISGLRADLLAAMDAYSTGRGFPLAYSPTAYPYFFNDNDGSGDYSAGDTNFGHWTPRLLKASQNLQMAYKEPGDWAHNTNYTAQVIIDSIRDLNGGAPDTYERPVGF